MRVDKVIIRAVLSTLAAAVVLFAFVTLALCFIFPSTMMELTFRADMNDASVKYAKRAYKYTGEAYYLAYGLDVAVWDKDYERIDDCGSLLLQAEGFLGYCEKRNEQLSQQGISMTYEQYVCGQVCTAKYALGDKSEAVEVAFSALTGNIFPENNAVVALLSIAKRAEDDETVNSIKTKLDGLSPALSETDKPYFEEIYANLING